MATLRPGGEILIAKLNLITGLPSTAFRFIGCADSFEPKFAIDEGSRTEGCSGLFQTVQTWERSKSGTFDIAAREVDPKNLALATGGTIVAAGEADTVVDEEIPAGVIAGDRWQLGADAQKTHENITTLVITDSATVPDTLTEGTDYTIEPIMGTVKFLNVAGFTQPFLASYGYTDKQYVSIFTDTQAEYLLRYNWRNADNSLARGGVEFFRSKFKTIPNLPLISQDPITLALSGAFLADLNRDVDAVYGQFGRVIPD